MTRLSQFRELNVGNDFFEMKPLNDHQKKYLIHKACESAKEVIERARSKGGPIHWRHVDTYNNTQIYTGRLKKQKTNSNEHNQHNDKKKNDTSLIMCGVTSICASIREIGSLFAFSTTEQVKKFSQENPDLYYDGLVLYDLMPRKLEKPMHQVTAKWIVSKAFSKNQEDRDFCYLECQNRFVDSNGRKGWVLSLHSIKIPGVKDLSMEYGIIRGSFYHSGIVVLESDRTGFVEIIHLLQINLKNNAVVSPKILTQRILFMQRLFDMVQKKRLCAQYYLNDLELIPKRLRSRCGVCLNRFVLMFLRKMNCRKCGEVICGACSKEIEIEKKTKNTSLSTTTTTINTITKQVLIQKLRICTRCLSNVMMTPRSTTNTTTTTSSSSRSPRPRHRRSSRDRGRGGHTMNSTGSSNEDKDDRAPLGLLLSNQTTPKKTEEKKQKENQHRHSSSCSTAQIAAQMNRNILQTSCDSSSFKKQRSVQFLPPSSDARTTNTTRDTSTSSSTSAVGTTAKTKRLEKSYSFMNNQMKPPLLLPSSRRGTALFDRKTSRSTDIFASPHNVSSKDSRATTMNLHDSRRYGHENKNKVRFDIHPQPLEKSNSKSNGGVKENHHTEKDESCNDQDDSNDRE
jgi:hypothetical protein